jgi:hypothetical protein
MPYIAQEVNKRLGVTTPAAPSTKLPATASRCPYRVRVVLRDKDDYVNIRTGPGTNYPVAKEKGELCRISKAGVFTIVEEARGPGADLWGLLKSKIGWVSLDYFVKV